MRLLTHNTLKNPSKDAKGKGFPLQLVTTNNHIRVRETAIQERDIEFVQRLLPSLDWPALIHAAGVCGIPTLPPLLTVELSQDQAFLRALYQVLMNVHVQQGILQCPVTGRQFPIQDGIPNLILDEEECETSRF